MAETRSWFPTVQRLRTERAPQRHGLVMDEMEWVYNTASIRFRGCRQGRGQHHASTHHKHRRVLRKARGEQHTAASSLRCKQQHRGAAIQQHRSFSTLPSPLQKKCSSFQELKRPPCLYHRLGSAACLPNRHAIVAPSDSAEPPSRVVVRGMGS